MNKLPARKNKREVSRNYEHTQIDVYGKVPPQNKEAEEAVLGAILLEKFAFDEVAMMLKPETFYVNGHQKIYEAMQSLHAAGHPLDTIVVGEWLKKSGDLEMVGGHYAISQLTNAVVSGANIVNHARIIIQTHISRELIRICGQMIGDAYNDADPFEMLDEMEQKYFELAGIDIGKGFSDVSVPMITMFQKMISLKASGDYVNGVRSGFPSIDKHTYGWQKTDLIILAARPSVGKTAFVLNLARNAAADNLRKGIDEDILLFSLEMDKTQLITRIIANESGVRMDKIRTGRVDDEEEKIIYQAMQRVAKMNLKIDDTPTITIRELRAKVRRHTRKRGVSVVMIDYLQLMNSESDKHSDSKNDQVGDISKGLKHLARELNIPVIALSQLSRKVEDRKGPPMLSDLRDSGAIEQDADGVFFLYRPDNFNNEDHATGIIHCKCAKYRNGQLFTASLHANLRLQRFSDDKEIAENEIGWKPREDFEGFGNVKKVSDIVRKQQQRMTGEKDDDEPQF